MRAAATKAATKGKGWLGFGDLKVGTSFKFHYGTMMVKNAPVMVKTSKDTYVDVADTVGREWLANPMTAVLATA